MESYTIRGGYALAGSITVQGAKNSILPILAASLLNSSRELIRLKKVPDLVDVRGMLSILSYLGVKVTWENADVLLETSQVSGHHVPETLMREMRSSIVLLGAMLGRFRKAKLYYPGGCAIGKRPIDLHLRGLQKMGAVIEESRGHIICQGGLRGTDILLSTPSVGATENLMMAAVLARGKTTIYNAAREPEIEDLQNFLNVIGADIEGAGSSTVVVEGVSELKGGEYRVFPDRIAAGTYIIAAVVTGGQLTIKEIIPEHLQPLLEKLRQTGAEVETGQDWVTVKSGDLNALPLVEIKPYPGFPTDMQPQLTALLSISRGKSILMEHVFPRRFHHIAQLSKMGAVITLRKNIAEIQGVRRLSGATVKATDLRAGAALVIAGLAAKGETVIQGIHHIERGYEDLPRRLNSLGACLDYSGHAEPAREVFL